MIRRLARLWNPLADADQVLEHVPVGRSPKKKDWRARALKAAARRHGKPFKTAATHLPREVMKDGKFIPVRPGEQPPDPAPAENVKPIKARKA